jgi:acetyl esterase/lipase
MYQPSARFEVRVFDVEIPREGSPLLARVYQPQGAGPFPMVIDEHGGAWSANDRTSDEWIDAPLAASGLLVLSPEFRIGPDDPFPGQLQDINLATRWLKAHAAELKGDPSTLGGIGFSSGGHTVVLSAMRPDHPTYSALRLSEAAEHDASLDYVISCWPVIDPLARYERAREKGNDELIEKHDRFFLSVETQMDANPIRMLERNEKVALPPTLVCHGTGDDSVPFEWVEHFADLYREAGGDIVVEPFEGAPHGFGRQAEYKDRLFEVTKAYIERQLATAAV